MIILGAMKRLLTSLTAILLGTMAAGGNELVAEDFTFASSFDGASPLYAAAVYEKESSPRPLMVVQHGYGGDRRSVGHSAARMARRGFFCVCIDSLKKNGGATKRYDCGGIEVMDIYDGIQAAIKKYPDMIDTGEISIVGYSGGGGTATFATVRFPFLFRASMSFFGIPDYGMWNAPGVRRRNWSMPTPVTIAVGGTVAEAPDKYLVRNAGLAAGNLCGRLFEMAYDERENICPVAMQEAFIQAVKKTGYRNLVVNISKEGDPHRWKHAHNSGQLDAAEDRFMDDIAKIDTPMPVMPPTGELVVLGYLVTPRFICVLGKGDDAAAKIKYEFTNDTARFVISPMTSDMKAKAAVTVPDDRLIDVRVDGQQVEIVKAGDKRKIEGTISSTMVISFRR